MSAQVTPPAKPTASPTPYGDEFYAEQMAGSYRSARIYVQHLSQYFRPRSVADVGCGRGTWLKAWLEAGAAAAVGLDGHWNRAESMIDPRIAFRPCDLDRPFGIDDAGPFDLAMSLEVAEHLEPSSAKDFVASLTKLSNVVLFGAAFTNQGGTQHLNEQHPSYWARLFQDAGHVPFDAFRPFLWGNRDVEVWYRQNTFLYVRADSQRFRELTAAGLQPVHHVEFLDCMHPELFQDKLKPTIRRGLRMVYQSGMTRLTAR